MTKTTILLFSFHMGIFFLGGGVSGRFKKLWISCDIRIQITWESVRLITVIGLKMFLTEVASRKSLRTNSRTRFRWSVLKKAVKWSFFPVLCIKCTKTYYNGYKTAKYGHFTAFFRTDHRNLVREYILMDFLDATSVKKTSSNRSR